MCLVFNLLPHRCVLLFIVDKWKKNRLVLPWICDYPNNIK